MQKISLLIESTLTTPFEGLGKPEQLKYELSGLWSRRINKKDRLVYEVIEEDNVLFIHSILGHYSD